MARQMKQGVAAAAAAAAATHPLIGRLALVYVSIID